MSHPSEIQLIELASRRLSAAEASALMAHIEHCAACGQALQELKRVHGALGGWRELDTDIDLVDTVAQQLDAGPRSSIHSLPWWVRSTAVAASLAASLIGGHLLARNVFAQQAVVLQPAIEDQMQLAVLAEPDRTGLSDLLNTDSDFDGVTP